MHNPICDSATGARPTGQRMPYEMVNLPSLPPAPANRYYDDQPLQHPVQRRCSGSEEDDRTYLLIVVGTLGSTGSKVNRFSCLCHGLSQPYSSGPGRRAS